MSPTIGQISTLLYDETSYVTAVAIVNPSPSAVTVAITALDIHGNVIGTGSLNLPPGNKTEAVLESIAGLNGVVGNRGTVQFSVSTGSVAVLGIRFNGSAFTQIPTIGMPGM